MKYKNDDYRAREARAQKAMANLVRLTNYRIAGEPALLPAPLREALHAPEAGVMFLASGGDYPFKLEEAVCEMRAAVLIVEPGMTTQGLTTVYVTLIRCVEGQIRWHRALRVWVSIEREPYLIPDEDGGDPEGESFLIGPKGIVPAAAPWTCELERGFGLGHADAILLAP